MHITYVARKFISIIDESNERQDGSNAAKCNQLGIHGEDELSMPDNDKESEVRQIITNFSDSITSEFKNKCDKV